MQSSFFKLPESQKRRLISSTSAYGYSGFREIHANPTESKDRKEAFMFHYEPEFDPLYQDSPDQIPAHVRQYLPKEDFVWADSGDEAVLPGFKSALLTHWRACLALCRRLVRVLALALELPEDHFDAVTTYPGGDFAVNFYPGHGEQPIDDPDEVGVGAHTDLQILTLLWQDDHKGLQVLNTAGEWMWAPPVAGTFVVNIGDFLMRVTNDRLQSTVHRVLQHGKEDRISMPFFFGKTPLKTPSIPHSFLPATSSPTAARLVCHWLRKHRAGGGPCLPRGLPRTKSCFFPLPVSS